MQVRQYLARLHADRLVVRLRADVSKAKEPTAPPVDSNPLTAASVRCYYGLDYTTLVDVVTYKLDAMERAIDEARRLACEVQLYRCARCGTTLDSLSISPFMMMEGALKCEVCASELDEVDNSDQMKEFDERKAQLRTCLQPLREALREVRGAEPPLYKRARTADEEDVQPSAALRAGGMSRTSGGGGGSGSSGNLGGGTETESTLGASRGPATSRTAADTPTISVPWMLSASEAAAQAKQTTVADGAASDSRPLDSKALAFEEYVRQTMEPSGLASAASSSAPLVEPCLAVAPSEPAPDVVEAPIELAESEKNMGERIEEEEPEVMVMVNGAPMPFSEVTEADQDMMTPEEYERYAALYEQAVAESS
mmetsp:Transcript_7580/g.23600  ORF Transcript_7580/g.23600 Transcript_7580/m.23600 type:complete len:368 (-) Transcript_7580:548-1651(-)